MKAKNKLLTLLILSAGATATIAVINKCLKISSTSKNLLSTPKSLCYKWRLGNIHYTKHGSGKPLLLIHDLNPVSSGHDWDQTISELQENYTVYVIDLLGFGRSEKVNTTYTNYLYVQLISDFIRTVIGHRTCVVASGESAAIPIMACSNNPDLFDQIMLINPLSIVDFCKIPGKTAKIYKAMIELPIVGTLLYNIIFSRKLITEYMRKEAFYNPFSVKAPYVDSCLEAAHLGSSPKSAYASTKCNYTKCNITNALKVIDNSIYLIGGLEIKSIQDRLEEYKTYNPAIEISYIPETKLLPQLEAPEKLTQLIKTYMN